MRFIKKTLKPQILVINEGKWLEEYKSDSSNKTKKYRYRNSEIKHALKIEVGSKCAYCESKIGHNTPGDIEHKIPSSKVMELHFSWTNLTIACSECNRRKNDYYVKGEEFLDPNDKNVELCIEHNGPFVSAKPGNVRAEISICILKLNSGDRIQLILQKFAKIEELNDLYARYNSEKNSTLKELLHQRLLEMTERSCEYSGMVLEILTKRGLVV